MNINEIDSNIFSKEPLGSQNKTNKQTNFGEIMSQFITDVNDSKLTANQMQADLANGKSDNITETVLATEKATVMFQFATTINSKLLDAYKEISRMQV